MNRTNDCYKLKEDDDRRSTRPVREQLTDRCFDTVVITHEGWCWTADGVVITLHPMINGTQTPELLSAQHRSV